MAKGKNQKITFRPGGQKGKLHNELGIPAGKKIPAAKLKQATKSKNPEIRKDAIRAETMKKWDHSGHKRGRSGKGKKG